MDDPGADLAGVQLPVLLAILDDHPVDARVAAIRNHEFGVAELVVLRPRPLKLLAAAHFTKGLCD